MHAHALYASALCMCLMAQEKATTSGKDAGLQKANPKGIYKGTREEWLEAAMGIMAVWLNTLLVTTQMKHPFVKGKMVSMARHFKLITDKMSDSLKKLIGKLPTPKFRLNEVAVSCSLMDAGMTKSSSLAHIHFKHSTGNSKHEIRMGVHVGGRKTKEQSNRVADILLHEMIHAVFPFDGHRGGFYWLAKAVGLNGPMTSTTASDALNQRIDKEVVKVLGRYPHKAVKLTPRGQRGKGSRLILCECPDCGCKLRLSRMWINKAIELQGYVICPIGCDEAMEI